LVFNSGKGTKANILLDTGTLQAIDEEAQAHGPTRSAFMASAARLAREIAVGHIGNRAETLGGQIRGVDRLQEPEGRAAECSPTRFATTVVESDCSLSQRLQFDMCARCVSRSRVSPGRAGDFDYGATRCGCAGEIAFGQISNGDGQRALASAHVQQRLPPKNFPDCVAARRWQS
jgi:hypothetical protein